MKLKRFIFVSSLLFCCLFFCRMGSAETASHDWVKIYYKDGLNKINLHLASEIDSIYYKIGENPDLMTLNVSVGNEDLVTIPLDSLESMVMGGNIPTLYIDTDPYVEEITSKVDYLDARIRYIPYQDGTDTLMNSVKIRGRGNSSWGFPKKPYRLKFDKKQDLAGLKKAKNFVLLSNYIDNTLMRNAVASKVAELLGMEYNHRMVPIELIFNGMKRGNYMLTNKVGINSGSVDIDEKEGILWELSIEMDEDFCFRSETFNLPCMVKDPDFYEIADNDTIMANEIWNYWQDDLENAFKEVDTGNWKSVFDAESFVNFFLVQTIVHNTETEFPKSLYIYKTSKDGKYKLGPVWDFDWALGYSQDINRGVIYKNCGSWEFLSHIFEDRDFLDMFGKAFDDFCENKLSKLLAYIDDYSSTIRDSALNDSLIWPDEHYDERYEKEERNTSRFDQNVENLKDWILKRIDIIKNSPTFLLY